MWVLVSFLSTLGQLLNCQVPGRLSTRSDLLRKYSAPAMFIGMYVGTDHRSWFHVWTAADSIVSGVHVYRRWCTYVVGGVYHIAVYFRSVKFSPKR